RIRATYKAKIWSVRFSITSSPKGPNGNHSCSVAVPERCSLDDCRSASNYRVSELSAARSLAAQLVIAVAYIHHQGYCHGDLHVGNILFRLPASIEYVSEGKRHGHFHGPWTPEPVVRVDKKPLGPGVPSHVYRPIWLGIRSDELTLPEARLRLADFGIAFRPAEEARLKPFAPLYSRSPEALFNQHKPFSFPSDIWSVALALWDMMGQSSLNSGLLFGHDEIVADLMDWDKWEDRSSWYEENGGESRGSRDASWTLDRRLHHSQRPRHAPGAEGTSDDETDAFCSLIRSMLNFRPGHRPHATQVLGFKWIQDWALNDYERTLKEASRVKWPRKPCGALLISGVLWITLIAYLASNLM
ncbi:hypothetical protein PpBr36_01946, partial [Pyricularia pennisetigena]|uniref:hypothetical protein n=1 Tax=Pyricularia pennisetigena TaxID=1578925 RepID=UPI0011519C94